MLWTVETHLSGKPSGSVALYEAFVAAVASCGPFTVSVSKSSITLKGTRPGFAGARLYVHHYRLSTPSDLDATFRSWIAEAYAVGVGAHLPA